MKIGDKYINDESSCFIIAEIGSNHNKKKEIAYKLIDVAIEAGVDAIKFQTLKSTDIASNQVLANTYGESKITDGKKIWSEVLEELVLPYEWHKDLFDYAKKRNIMVFSTPESIEAVELLEELEVPVYKIASMDITYKQLLIRVAKTKKPVIISSGIATINDINNAISILRENGSTEIALLHCVSEYPPKYEMMSLNIIKKYKNIFDIPIGLSNHCQNNIIDGVAVALGARIIEKHITLDKNMDGPDHNFALEPVELRDLVKNIRIVEKSIIISDKMTESKRRKKLEYGRSVIANRDMNAGEKISFDDLDYKRPGYGISPFDAELICGLKLTKSIVKGHTFNWEDFK